MTTISAIQLRRMIDGNEAFELINVLPETDFQKEHIPGSMNIPVADSDFVSRVEDRVGGDKNHKIVVYCASTQCDASSKAAGKLEKAGFSNILRYEAGMQGWKDAGYAIESGAMRV